MLVLLFVLHLLCLPLTFAADEDVIYELSLIHFFEPTPNSYPCRLQAILSPNNQDYPTLNYFLFALNDSEGSCYNDCKNISFGTFFEDYCNFVIGGTICGKYSCDLPYTFQVNAGQNIGDYTSSYKVLIFYSIYSKIYQFLHFSFLSPKIIQASKLSKIMLSI